MKINNYDIITDMQERKHQNIALYTKYRPQTFADVVGQDHIIKTVQSAIKDNKVSHAYLFSGGRGIGKTTIARIIAHELDTDERDVTEIDAASHTGVDDIREIRDSVHTLPFNSKYKVYILDEAHMLSKSAFNALLKTLEEPPAHVIFILATTEPEKIPDTIHSRCEGYVFKQPTRKTIAKRVAYVAKEEGYELGNSAIDLMAILADGSFRDALGVLQKVLASAKSKKIDIEEVEEITGAPKSALLNDLLKAMTMQSIDDALSTLVQAVQSGADMLLFQQLLLSRARAVLLLRVAASMKADLQKEFNADDFTFIEELAKDKEAKINSKTILALLDAYTQTPKAHIQSLPLELALIGLLDKEKII